MGGSSIQQLLDDLAHDLQRSVVVNDPDVVLLFASAHFGDEDEVRTHAILQRQASNAAIGHVLAQGVGTWTSPGSIPANEAIGMHARVCVPVRWHGELLGLMLVVDRDGTVTTGELARMEAVAGEVAALMVGERAAGGARAGERDDLIEAALDRRPVVRLEAVRRLATGPDLLPTAHLRVLSVVPLGSAPAGPHLAGALRAATGAADRAPGAVRRAAVVRADAATVLIGSPEPISAARAREHADRLVRAADEIGAGRFAVVAGVGGAVAGLDAAWVSHRQALVATRAARAGRGPVAVWEGLGAEALLVRIPREDLDVETLPDGLRRLLEADRDGRLVETLGAYLDRAGSVPATAQALRIHRTTLYYRLHRIAELADVDLDDGETRLMLHLGLRMWRRLVATE